MATAISTTQLTLIQDHPDRAVANALAQDRSSQDSPRYVSLLEAMGEGVQLQEEQFFDLLVGRGLNLATGVSLEQWGAIVGEQRGGLNDEDYRRFIKARILANISEGTPDELLTVFALVTSPSQVRYFIHPPAGFRLQTIRNELLSDALVRRIVRLMVSIKPAGVAMVLTEALQDSILFGVAGRGFGSTFSRVL